MAKSESRSAYRGGAYKKKRVFLAELAKNLASDNGGFTTHNSKINSIFWADDIVLLCEDKTQLERMIKMTLEYCETNKLTINTKKTKCIIFNKTGRLIRDQIFPNLHWNIAPALICWYFRAPCSAQI